MKRKLLLCLLLGVLLWCTPAYAQNVSVQVPTFPVELNDVAYDNQRASYPLLVYQDVTYFPMTYRMTRSMGLITAWAPNKLLKQRILFIYLNQRKIGTVEIPHRPDT